MLKARWLEVSSFRWFDFSVGQEVTEGARINFRDSSVAPFAQRDATGIPGVEVVLTSGPLQDFSALCDAKAFCGCLMGLELHTGSAWRSLAGLGMTPLDAESFLHPYETEELFSLL